MDTRLLDYYNRELAYLRELGGEFAQQFPKVAARLRMHESGRPIRTSSGCSKASAFSPRACN